MFRVTKQYLGLMPRRRSAIALIALAVPIAAVAGASTAVAGTYPMYQCSSSDESVAPGWSVFEGTNTVVGVSFSNTCQSGGVIGVEPSGGRVTEDGDNNGGTVGLALNVPASAPDVSISAISAQVMVSPVSGDDAFVNFDSDGQGLQGLEDLNGGNGIDADENWTLPLGARDFEASVFCSTDGSNTTCYYPHWNVVPGLNDITITLSDPTPPRVEGATGTLVNAAAHGSTVSGSQTIGFTAKDADSGVLSTTLTLTPQSSGAPYTKTINFSGQCTYDSWNACPLQQSVGAFSVPTATLKDGTYAVNLSVTDAAGNVASESLGTITTHNAPVISSPPLLSGSPVVGQTLSAIPGSIDSNPEAGTPTNAGQWLSCDASAANCVPLTGATGASYNPTAADIGHAIRYQDTVSNNAGSVVGESAPLGPVTPSSAELEKAEKEKLEKEKAEKERGEKGQNGAAGSNGSAGAPGSNGADGASSSSGTGVTINLPGSNLGSVTLGSTAKWVLSLHVNPLRVHRGTKIKLTGLVSSSPRPTEGKLIYLQARSVTSKWKGSGRSRHEVNAFSKWVTFQAFRAQADGAFSSTYTFRLGGKHTYQFQAVAPAEGQYRNPTGTSLTATVKEGR
jgi:hypothetical protein